MTVYEVTDCADEGATDCDDEKKLEAISQGVMDNDRSGHGRNPLGRRKELSGERLMA